MLDSGGVATDLVGESAPDSNPDCKPDPMALLRTQDLLRSCKDEAEAAGMHNVKMTTLVSCVGGSADMVGAGGGGSEELCRPMGQAIERVIIDCQT